VEPRGVLRIRLSRAGRCEQAANRLTVIQITLFSIVYIDCRLNDCDESLEETTGNVNRAHRRLLSHPIKTNTSGFRNVRKVGGRFQVEVANKYIGQFTSLAEAAKVAEKRSPEDHRRTTDKGAWAEVSLGSRIMLAFAADCSLQIQRGVTRGAKEQDAG
jgi:hypothetical protein